MATANNAIPIFLIKIIKKLKEKYNTLRHLLIDDF